MCDERPFLIMRPERLRPLTYSLASPLWRALCLDDKPVNYSDCRFAGLFIICVRQLHQLPCVL
jgi:hypothetical protein